MISVLQLCVRIHFTNFFRTGQPIAGRPAEADDMTMAVMMEDEQEEPAAGLYTAVGVALATPATTPVRTTWSTRMSQI